MAKNVSAVRSPGHPGVSRRLEPVFDDRLFEDSDHGGLFREDDEFRRGPTAAGDTTATEDDADAEEGSECSMERLPTPTPVATSSARTPRNEPGAPGTPSTPGTCGSRSSEHDEEAERLIVQAGQVAEAAGITVTGWVDGVDGPIEERLDVVATVIDTMYGHGEQNAAIVEFREDELERARTPPSVRRRRKRIEKRKSALATAVRRRRKRQELHQEDSDDGMMYRHQRAQVGHALSDPFHVPRLHRREEALPLGTMPRDLKLAHEAAHEAAHEQAHEQAHEHHQDDLGGGHNDHHHGGGGKQDDDGGKYHDAATTRMPGEREKRPPEVEHKQCVVVGDNRATEERAAALSVGGQALAAAAAAAPPPPPAGGNDEIGDESSSDFELSAPELSRPGSAVSELSALSGSLETPRSPPSPPTTLVEGDFAAGAAGAATGGREKKPLHCPRRWASAKRSIDLVRVATASAAAAAAAGSGGEITSNKRSGGEADQEEEEEEEEEQHDDGLRNLLSCDADEIKAWTVEVVAQYAGAVARSFPALIKRHPIEAYVSFVRKEEVCGSRLLDLAKEPRSLQRLSPTLFKMVPCLTFLKPIVTALHAKRVQARLLREDAM